MSRPIKEGDTVTLRYSDGSAEFGFTVLHTPSDSGDLWYLKAAWGVIMGINPSSTKLHAIELDKEGGSKNETT
jgi:hypothetical protein